MVTLHTRKGESFQLDEKDLELVAPYTWFINNRGYVVASPRRGNTHDTVLMHRLILGVVGNRNLIVDHINGDPKDNRRENIRICSHEENMRNSKLRSNNKSGLKGACYKRRNRKWAAQIQTNGTKKHLGLFDTAESAHEFYCLAADLLYGEFANYGYERG